MKTGITTVMRMSTGAALAGALTALISVSAHASFDVPFESVRSASMGQASMASIGEAPTLFTNPAGLAPMRTGQASFMYDRMYTGLPGIGNIGTGFMAIGVPTRYGSFGLGYGDFMASGLKEERTIALSYAHAVTSRIQLGLTAKDLYNHYEAGGDALSARDPLFANGQSKSAFGLDMGAIVSISGPLKAGLSIQNLNRPDVGIATEDRLSRQVQAGLIFDMAGIGLRATGDMQYAESGTGTADQSKVLPVLGLEKVIAAGHGTGLAFRLGANPTEFTAGLGLQMGRIGFDYGFGMSREIMGDNFGTQRLGMNYAFGEGIDSADSSKPEPSRHRLSNDDDFDYLNLDNKALFGK